ncbi:Uncharacterised protein [Bifidobacterium catenulatum]|nr:Uncharacterised protein [Bifidobacterium catenulatum]
MNKIIQINQISSLHKGVDYLGKTFFIIPLICC